MPGVSERALPWVSYALLGLVAFYPLSVQAWNHVLYVGDPLESVYIVAWNVHQFFRDPLHTFDANVLHPSAHALAFTDHRLLPSLLVAPVVWLTGNAVFAGNLAIALACLLAAGAARHLARTLGAAGVAAWAAGALYAFHTYQVHEAGRLNIISHGFLPLALGQLVLYLKTGRRRHAWQTAGLMLLQGLSSNYHLLYGCLLLGLILLGVVIAHPRETAGRLPALALATATAAALFTPVALVYLDVARTHGHSRSLPPSMGLEHYVTTLPTNLIYGAMGPELRGQQRGPHFLGFSSLVLAGYAVLGVLRRRDDSPGGLLPSRVWVGPAAGLALLLGALSLGRNVVLMGHYLAPGPYRLLYRGVPGFDLMRLPERLSLLAMLFVALLVAHGLTLLERGGRRRLALVLAALVPLEHLSPGAATTRVPVRDEVPAVYRWLAGSRARALAEVPVRGEGLVRQETIDMYFSTFHWKPVIHGYTAYPPLLTRLLRRLAAQFPSEATLQAFTRVGVDTVVVHYGRETAVDLYRQVQGRAEEKDERFRKLLHASGMDLYRQLPVAALSGRIVREAVFDGSGARLHGSTRDEVYRIAHAPVRPAAPFPGGRRLRRAGWQYRARSGDAAAAADGRLETAWHDPEPLDGDEFLEVAFDRPTAVSGVVFPLRWDSVFPTRFRIDGREVGGEWTPLARFGEAHVLQLVERLLSEPAHAAMGFLLDGREIVGLRLAVEAGGTSFDGWSVPEIDVRVN